MRALALVLFLASLSLPGCGDAPAAPAKSREQRVAEAERKLSAIPKPRRYQVGESELMVLEIPVTDNGRHVDTQRCFVWRDRPEAAGSIACPQPPMIGGE